jgi:hypothetical protein
MTCLGLGGLPWHSSQSLELPVELFCLPTAGCCLRHSRAASMGWPFTSRCDPCMVRFRENLHSLTGCVAPAGPCSCNACTRQPPTLRDMASRTLFSLSLNPDRFELTREVTHCEFVHAVNSGWARVDRCLPTYLTSPSTTATEPAPAWPTTTIAFLHCPGMPPLPGFSVRPRRRSVSCSRAETNIGEHVARSRCSFRMSVPYMLMGTSSKLIFQINCLRSKFKINSPFQNSKL